jgi:hypothetical protein
LAELIRWLGGLDEQFRQFDRATGFLLSPSLDEWLPERHLARFVVEVIDGRKPWPLAVGSGYWSSSAAAVAPGQQGASYA